jgi:hypothetical protein
MSLRSNPFGASFVQWLFLCMVSGLLLAACNGGGVWDLAPAHGFACSGSSCPACSPPLHPNILLGTTGSPAERLDLREGETLQLTANWAAAGDSCGSLMVGPPGWTSTNLGVASVSASGDDRGLLVARAPGATSIYFTFTDTRYSIAQRSDVIYVSVVSN